MAHNYRNPQDRGRDWERARAARHYPGGSDRDRYETGDERRWSSDWDEETSGRRGWQGDERYENAGYREEFGHRNEPGRWASRPRHWERDRDWERDRGMTGRERGTSANDSDAVWQGARSSDDVWQGTRRGGSSGQQSRGYAESGWGRGGWNDQSRWSDDWPEEEVPYYGTGRHYGGGYGTAPGSQATGEGYYRDLEEDERWRQSGYGYGDQSGYGAQDYGAQSRYGAQSGYGSRGLGRQGMQGSGSRSQYSGDWYGSRSGYGSQSQNRQSFQGRGPKGYERSDERLREMICERLTDDPRIDASDITVDVSQHVVRLNGNVDDRRTKYEIEELVERCGGVQDIDNQLRVRQSQSRSAESSFGTSTQQSGASKSARSGEQAGSSSGTGPGRA